MVGVTLASTLAFAQDAGIDAEGVLPPVLVHASPALWPEDGGTGGDVELLLTIDSTGLVTDAQVQSSPGEAFSVAALLAAKGLVFEPASTSSGRSPTSRPTSVSAWAARCSGSRG